MVDDGATYWVADIIQNFTSVFTASQSFALAQVRPCFAKAAHDFRIATTARIRRPPSAQAVSTLVEAKGYTDSQVAAALSTSTSFAAAAVDNAASTTLSSATAYASTQVVTSASSQAVASEALQSLLTTAINNVGTTGYANLTAAINALTTGQVQPLSTSIRSTNNTLVNVQTSTVNTALVGDPSDCMH